MGYGRGTYGQEDIAEIHKDVNDRTDSGVIHVVARDDQGDGQDVMRKHLPVILPWLFRVNNVELVEPPSELGEVIEFGHGGQEGMWVSGP